MYNKKDTSLTKNSKTALLRAVLLFFVYSCTPNESIYTASKDIDPTRFDQSLHWQFVHLRVDVRDSLDLYIQTRHHVDYGYENIGLALHITQKNQTLLADTVDLRLTDDTGKWIGSGWGSLFDHTQRVGSVKIYPNDTVYVSIKPLMNDWQLKGLSALGFTLARREHQ